MGGLLSDFLVFLFFPRSVSNPFFLWFSSQRCWVHLYLRLCLECVTVTSPNDWTPAFRDTTVYPIIPVVSLEGIRDLIKHNFGVTVLLLIISPGDGEDGGWRMEVERMPSGLGSSWLVSCWVFFFFQSPTWCLLSWTSRTTGGFRSCTGWLSLLGETLHRWQHGWCLTFRPHCSCFRNGQALLGLRQFSISPVRMIWRSIIYSALPTFRSAAKMTEGFSLTRPYSFRRPKCTYF